MSARIMFRKCLFCHHEYTHNPSVGDFGTICPKCHKSQSVLESAPTLFDIVGKDELKSVGQLWKHRKTK